MNLVMPPIDETSGSGPGRRRSVIAVSVVAFLLVSWLIFQIWQTRQEPDVWSLVPIKLRPVPPTEEEVVGQRRFEREFPRFAQDAQNPNLFYWVIRPFTDICYLEKGGDPKIIGDSLARDWDPGAPPRLPESIEPFWRAHQLAEGRYPQVAELDHYIEVLSSGPYRTHEEAPPATGFQLARQVSTIKGLYLAEEGRILLMLQQGAEEPARAAFLRLLDMNIRRLQSAEYWGEVDQELDAFVLVANRYPQVFDGQERAILERLDRLEALYAGMPLQLARLRLERLERGLSTTNTFRKRATLGRYAELLEEDIQASSLSNWPPAPSPRRMYLFRRGHYTGEPAARRAFWDAIGPDPSVLEQHQRECTGFDNFPNSAVSRIVAMRFLLRWRLREVTLADLPLLDPEANQLYLAWPTWESDANGHLIERVGIAGGNNHYDHTGESKGQPFPHERLRRIFSYYLTTTRPASL